MTHSAEQSVVAAEAMMHAQSITMALTGLALAEKRIVITPQALGALPLGVLAFVWDDFGGLDVIYVEVPNARPSEDEAELALMAIVHQRDGIGFNARQIEQIVACDADPTERVVIQFIGDGLEVELETNVPIEGSRHG